MTAVGLCGMPSEKRILTKGLPNTLILSGADKFNLRKLVPPTCTRLISLGVCGGLSPYLKVPDVAIATVVVDRGGDLAYPDGVWNVAAMSAARGMTVHGVQYYSSGLMDEADAPGQRAALFDKTGAQAIDDETRFMIAEARERGIKFNVVRPLSDAYDDNLPLMARGKIMNEDGSPNIGFLLSSMGQDQGDNSESIFTVAMHYGQSLSALEELARRLAPLIAEE